MESARLLLYYHFIKVPPLPKASQATHASTPTSPRDLSAPPLLSGDQCQHPHFSPRSSGFCADFPEPRTSQANCPHFPQRRILKGKVTETPGEGPAAGLDHGGPRNQGAPLTVPNLQA